MLDLLYSFFVHLLENICDIGIILSLNHLKWSGISRRRLLLIPCNCLIVTLLEQICPPASAVILSILCSVVIYCLLLSLPLADTFFSFIFTYSIVDLVQCLIIMILPQNTLALFSVYVEIGGNLFLILLSVIVYLKLPIWRFFSKYILQNRIGQLILFCIFIIQLYNVIYSKTSPLTALTQLPVILLFAFALIVSFLNLLQQQKKCQQLQTRLEDYQTYEPIFDELVEHVRIRQHEFDNQLLAIRALPLTHKDYPSLSYALTNEVVEIMQNLQCTTLVKINLKVVAALLFAKMQQAEKDGIHLNIVVKNSNLQTAMPEHELLEVVGILLDNAIEAVNPGESITVTLDSFENMIEITTLNKGPLVTYEMRGKFFQKGYSTKNPTPAKPKRGYGLFHLKEMVDSYNGKIMLNSKKSPEGYLVDIRVTI